MSYQADTVPTIQIGPKLFAQSSRIARNHTAGGGQNMGG